MGSYSTNIWGYKLISDTQINFYHVLLPKVKLNSLSSYLPGTTIEKHTDGSITISLSTPANPSIIVQKILAFFNAKSLNYLDTTNYYYKVDSSTRQLLKSWALSFEGCLALMLANDKDIKKHIDGNWQFTNAEVGGLFIAPFTLSLNYDHAKIIHPITTKNYEIRKLIEQKTAFFIRKMIKEITTAHPGFAGQAMLGTVEAKTGISSKEICKMINDLSFGIKNPDSCPFFNA